MERGRKSWFERNWWWSLPCGCLGCLGLLLGSCALLVGGAWTAFRGAVPTDEALALAQAHPVVAAALGEPIEAGWQMDANVDYRDGRTTATFGLPLRGPRGEARMRGDAVRQGDVWRFERLEVVLDDGTIVDLLASTPAPDATAPAEI